MLILKKTQAPSYCLGMLWFVSDSWLIRGIESIFHWEIRWKRSSYFSWKQSSRTRQLSSSYAVTMGTNSLWRYFLISISLWVDEILLKHWADDKQSKARDSDSKYRQMALVGFDTYTTDLGWDSWLLRVNPLVKQKQCKITLDGPDRFHT